MSDECLTQERRNKSKDKFKEKKKHPYRRNYKKDNKIVENIKEALKIIFVVFSGIFCLLSFIFAAATLGGFFSNKVIDSENSFLTKCNNTDLFNASECLNKELNTFYKYNITNVGKVMTETELIKFGGVCEHYSNWYAFNLKAMGFRVDQKLLVQDASKKFLHKFAIAYSKYGYCILDQMALNCSRYQLD